MVNAFTVGLTRAALVWYFPTGVRKEHMMWKRRMA
jgi:hypothetical protein